MSTAASVGSHLPPLHQNGGTATGIYGMNANAPLPASAMATHPIPIPTNFRTAPGSVTTTSSPTSYFQLQQLQLDDKEVVASNLTERTRLLLDILQMPPPPPPQVQSTKDPNAPPSPKPLFGSRLPPVALAMTRGFGGTSQERPDRSNSPTTPPAAGGGGSSYANAFDGPSSGSSTASGGFPRPPRKEGPLCCGWLSMQKNPGKWKRFWCEYSSEGILSYRIDDTTKKPVGTIQVTYCEAEITQLTGTQLSSSRRSIAGAGNGEIGSAESAVSDGLSRLSFERAHTTPVGGAGSTILPAIHSAAGGNGAAGSGLNPASTLVPASQLASVSLPMTLFDQLYWSYLEEEQAFWCFKVFSPTRVFLFKADNPGSPAALQAAASSSNPAASNCGEELRNQFVLTIRTHLQQLFAGAVSPPTVGAVPSLPLLNPSAAGGDSPQRVPSPNPPVASSSTSPPSAAPGAGTSVLSPSLIYKQKHECIVELNPLLHEQFIIQTNRYKALQAALNKQGITEDELPITSVRKEKSGVLCMEQAGGSEKPGTGTTAANVGGTAGAGAASSSSSSTSSSASTAPSSAEDAKWRDYYFVLFEGSLFYYKDSKSTTPTGFITLRYASLIVDRKRLSKQEFVFQVATPLRTICCKTKHSVALSEWISVLQHSLVQHVQKKPGSASPRESSGAGFHRDNLHGGFGKQHSFTGMIGTGGSNPTTPLKPTWRHHSFGGPGDSPAGSPTHAVAARESFGGPGSDRKGSSSLSVLESINKWINNQAGSIVNFQTLSQQPMALEYFRKFLASNPDEAGMTGPPGGAKTATPHTHLDFYLATQEYINLFTSPTPPPTSELSSLATQVFSRFLTPSNPSEFLSETTEDQRGILEDRLAAPTGTMFDTIRSISIAILDAEFAEFRRTPEYSSLNEILNKSVVEDKREVEAFDPDSRQRFLVKVKGTKKTRPVDLEKDKKMLTIGRDKSNMHVIEDSRVSRSHARVEYNNTQCEYIDLGSSCGSKLNGKPVLRARLRPGDVIELGQSVLIFQVQKPLTRFEKLAAYMGINKHS